METSCGRPFNKARSSLFECQSATFDNLSAAIIELTTNLLGAYPTLHKATSNNPFVLPDYTGGFYKTCKESVRNTKLEELSRYNVLEDGNYKKQHFPVEDDDLFYKLYVPS